MKGSRREGRVVALACCAVLTVFLTTLHAAPDEFGGFGGDSLLPALGPDKPTVTVSLTPADAQPGEEVRLSVRITLPAGSATYSQDPGFKKPTVIAVSESNGLEPLEDKYVPDRTPQRSFDALFNQEVEKFTGEVTYARRFRLRTGVLAGAVFVRGKVDYLVCDADSCRPYKHEFAVTLTGNPAPPPGATLADIVAAPAAAPVYARELRPTTKVAGKEKDEPLTIKYSLSPEDAAVGEKVTLTIEVNVEGDWHTFSREKADNQVGLPTEILLDVMNNLEPTGDYKESPKAKLEATDLVHHGKVTWTREFQVTGRNGYGLSGALKYMICDGKAQCKPPKKIPFTLGVVPASNASAAGESVLPRGEDGTASIAIPPFRLDEAEPPTNLAMNLLFAFLGGLLLNIMPCVLPVIAIKVLSFVQQAGESRGRILALNLTYSVGVISVFLALAGVAVFLGQSWGSQFQNQTFNLVMAAIVFAMGLSLLGVFEIPVPGMVGSAAGGVHREGLPGACMTGVFATLLATPCSGPFMGTTLAWSLKQAPHIVFLVWGVMGLGMASPYLLIGMFPRLVHWLPRPGMWMVRFKEFAGFVLMGAVIWIVTFLNSQLIIPALIVFVGIALGLWMIGNLYDATTPPRKKWTVRGSALVLSLAIFGFAYQLQKAEQRLPWETFSTARVLELRAQGKPILIDFTADWCNICKANEWAALNRPATIRFVEQHGVVPLMADYTDQDEEIKRWLDLCRQDGVPLTLIFPRGRPDEAIPLRGPYSQSTLLAKLQLAVSGGDQEGPSAVMAAEEPLSAAPAGLVGTR